MGKNRKKTPRSDARNPPGPENVGSSSKRESSGGFRAFSDRADAIGSANKPFNIDHHDPLLEKNLSIREARHILSAEGGELTLRELVIEILWAVTLSATLAWSIAVGRATAWHLLVPMIAEYIAYLLALPIFHLLYRHPGIRKESRQCLRMIAVLVFATGAILWYRSRYAEGTLSAQWRVDSAMAWEWIVGTHMQWPMLVAAFHAVRNLSRSVQHLVKNGPPFLGAGMGCGMRIAILVLAAVIVPAFGMVFFSTIRDLGWKWSPPLNLLTLAWALWGCLFLADLCTLWFRWDVQSKLKKRGYSIGN